MNTPKLDEPIIKIENSFESINQFFLENDLTDGLPIIPPTKDRVQLMTEYVYTTLGWSAKDEIGKVAPKNGIATIENIAANAVMAGCRPEYMPIIIACVKGISEPKFNLDALQTSTHNTSVLPIVNGPIVNSINLNYGYNFTGSSWQSTACIGRALRLIMSNIGGTPGSINIHTQGHIARYEHCIAENEQENPWEPLHVEKGFSVDSNVVTLIPACPAAMIDDNGGSQTAKELLRTISSSIAYVGNRNINGQGQPLIILCPQHARLLALGQYSKQDVKHFIWERARVRSGDIPRGNLVSFSKENLKFYDQIDDNYGYPIASKPEDIEIIVMGGTGTHSLSVQTRLACENLSIAVTKKDGTLFKI